MSQQSSLTSLMSRPTLDVPDAPKVRVTLPKVRVCDLPDEEAPSLTLVPQRYLPTEYTSPVYSKCFLCPKGTPKTTSVKDRAGVVEMIGQVWWRMDRIGDVERG